MTKILTTPQGQEYNEGDDYPQYIPSPNYKHSEYEDDKYFYETGEKAPESSGWFDHGKFFGHDVSTQVQDTVELLAGLPIGSGRGLFGHVGRAVTGSEKFIDALDSLVQGKENNMDTDDILATGLFMNSIGAAASGLPDIERATRPVSAVNTRGGTMVTSEALEEMVDRVNPVHNLTIDLGLRQPHGNGVLNDLVDAGVVDEDGFSQSAYDMLASHGRGGDSEIAVVDGEVSHVNSFEDDLIQNYGSVGEDLVKEIGSGTINPDTGLKEYKPLIGSRNWDKIGHWLTGKGGRRPKWRPSTGQWGIFGSSSASDERLRLYGSRDKDAKEKYMARKVVESGIDNLKSQLSASLGEGGTIQATEDIGFTKADQAYNQQVRSNKAQTKKVIRGSGLAHAKSKIAASGLSEMDTEEALNELELAANMSSDERQVAQDELRLTTKKAKLDLAATLQSELNSLMLTYQQTVDDTWDSSYQDELESQLDSLRTNA